MYHGEILKQAIDQQGISLDEVSVQMGCPKESLDLFLFRKNKFDKKMIDRICGRLGINKSIFNSSVDADAIETLVDDLLRLRIEFDKLVARIETLEKKNP